MEISRLDRYNKNMPLTQTQILQLKNKLQAQGMTNDQIEAGIMQFSQQYSGGQQQTSLMSQSTPVPATNVQQNTQSQTPQPSSLVGSFFKSLYQPFQNAQNAVGEAYNVATTPGMIKSALNMELTDEELESVMNYQPKYLDEKVVEDRGELAKYGAKTTAGLAAYAIPAGGSVKAAAGLGAVSGGLDSYARDEDIVTGASLGAVGGAAAPVVGRVLSSGRSVGNRVVNKLINPFTSQYDDEIVKLAMEKGVDLPLSARTSSNAVKQMEAVAQKSLFGGSVTKRIIAARDQVAKLSQDLTEELTGSLDKKSIGDVVKKGFSKFEDTFTSTKTNLYNKIPKSVDNLPASTDSTRELLEKIAQRRGKSLVANESTFFDQITSKLDGDLTFSNLKQTRTDIINKLKNFNDPVATGNKADLKALVASLSDDIEETIARSDPNSYKLLQQANEYFREGLTKINSQVGKKIKNADPEKLLDTLVKPNSETNIALVKSMLDEQGVKELQDGFMTKIYNDSVHSTRQTVDISKLRSQIKKYGESSIKELVGEENFTQFTQTIDDLEQISKLQQAINRGVKPAEGSQTAYLLNTMMYAGGLAISPAAVVGAIGGGAALTKLLTSESGQRLLTEGLGEIVQNSGSKVGGDVLNAAQRILRLAAIRVGAESQSQVGGVPASASEETTSTIDNQIQNTTTNSFVEETPEPFGGRSKGELLQLALAEGASLSDLKEIGDIYDLITGENDKVKSKELSVTAENKVQLGQSGLRALDSLEKIMKDRPSAVLLSKVPGQLGARDYDSAAFKSVEALLRARSGAAIPEEEVRRYMRANLPRLGDSQATIDSKLKSLRRDLEDVATTGGTDLEQRVDNAGGSYQQSSLPEGSQVMQSGEDVNLVRNFVENVNDAVVREAMASEDVSITTEDWADEWEAQRNDDNKGFVQKVMQTVMNIFQKKNPELVSPQPEQKQEDYNLQQNEDGSYTITSGASTPTPKTSQAKEPQDYTVTKLSDGSYRVTSSTEDVVTTKQKVDDFEFVNPQGTKLEESPKPKRINPSKMVKTYPPKEPNEPRISKSGSKVQADVANFIEEQVFPITRKYGIPDAVAAGQFAAEGRHVKGVGADRNNFFNLGAFDSNPYNAFMYKTPEEGIEAYAKLITNRYKKALKGKTPEEIVKGIQDLGYAGDPKTYDARSENIYKSYSDFIFDTPEYKYYSGN